MSFVAVFSLDFPVFVLNQATQKYTCQFFLPYKIRESKISNPKKSLDHPRHLKSGVPRSGAPDSDGRLGKRSKNFPSCNVRILMLLTSRWRTRCELLKFMVRNEQENGIMMDSKACHFLLFILLACLMVISEVRKALLGFCPLSKQRCFTFQGHPTTIFGKISVRKTI